MDEDTRALENLETFMNEFFSPGTSNERKRIINGIFQEFSSQIDSWRPCLHFLSTTKIDYVSMFALSTLETTIAKRWPILSWEDKALTRSTLYTLSLEARVAPFVRKKVVKLVVDIARFDWPHFYPDFYSNVLQLLNHKHTRLLGLIYLRTASEELATPRDDLPLQRKNELLRLLTAQVPLTLDTLTIMLNESRRLENRSGTVTPPPSPTSDQNIQTVRSVINVEGLAMETGDVCMAILEVLSHFFSWIPLNDQMPITLLEALFSCAKYHDSMNGKQIEIAIQAMTTINELLYRPLCSPNMIDGLLLQLFVNGIGLFQAMERLENIDESYMEKTTEFLQLFITNHLKKIESSKKFPINTLFEILCHQTFQQCTTLPVYLRCLEIWTNFLESTQSRYSVVALALVEWVLQKMSFKMNGQVLKNLDTESLDDNEETEWQHFLRCNIECLAKIAEISPIPVFTTLCRFWREDLVVYGKLGSALTNQQVILLNETEASNVHTHLRDLASNTQALARLYSIFIDETGIDQSMAEELVSQILDACIFARDNALHKGSIQPAVIVIDVVEVHSQLLASLQAWCQWMVTKPDKIKELLCQRCIDCCMWVFVQDTTNYDQRPPQSLVHSAIHLFQSVTAIFKPNLWDQATFRNLISTGSYPYLKSDTAKVLRRALINAIILPTGDSALRQRLLGTMWNSLSEPLGCRGQSIPTPSNPTLTTSLTALTQLLDDCSSASTTIKKMLHPCLITTIDRALEILDYIIKCQNTAELVLIFLHSTFLVLQQQLGPEFIGKTVQELLNIYTREDISAGPALNKFLEILILVVSASSSAFKAFVPSIINLCLTQVWPTLMNELSAHPDTTIVLLKLCHSILVNRWQYFYNTHILQSLTRTDENETVEHKEELVAILEIFGQSLLQPDINIFRQSLQNLEQLNVRWRLYQRSVFKEHLLERFLMALFTVLFQQSHNLLADEISLAIHSLASVYAPWFFGHFLPTFLASCRGVDDMQRNALLQNFDKSMDQPTLTRSVLRLISDLRFYQFCRPV